MSSSRTLLRAMLAAALLSASLAPAAHGASALRIPGVTPAPTEAHDTVPGPAPARSRSGRALTGVAGAATGNRTVLVVRVNFSDVTYTTNPTTLAEYSVAGVRERLTGATTSSAAMFRAQSGGRVDLVGASGADADVTDWVTLSRANWGPSTTPIDDRCDMGALQNEADAALQAANSPYYPDDYDHVIYLMPLYDGCGFAGLGQVPGSRVWINGFYAAYDPGPPAVGRPRDEIVDSAVVFHEIGHNLGVVHASTAACTTAQDATTARFAIAGCSLPTSASDPTLRMPTREYGDPYEAMGTELYSFPWRGSELMSNWRRAQLLQLAEADQQLVPQAGTYRLGAGGVQLLRIPRGAAAVPSSGATPEFSLERISGRVYPELALEYRPASSGPFDLWNLDPVGDAVSGGVLVRLVPALAISGRSFLLDGTPETRQAYATDGGNYSTFNAQFRTAWRDAALTPGRRLTDALTGITVQVDSVDSGGATVTVGGGPLDPTGGSTTPTGTTPTGDGSTPTSPTSRTPAARLVFPKPKNGVIRMTKTRRFVVEVIGAGPISASFHGRTLGRQSGGRGRWQVPRAALRKGTIRIVAWGRQLTEPVTATLRIRNGVATFSVDQ